MAFHHALRVSELVSLRWEQIHLDTATVDIKRAKNGTPGIEAYRATNSGYCAPYGASKPGLDGKRCFVRVIDEANEEVYRTLLEPVPKWSLHR